MGRWVDRCHDWLDDGFSSIVRDGKGQISPVGASGDDGIQLRKRQARESVSNRGGGPHRVGHWECLKSLKRSSAQGRGGDGDGLGDDGVLGRRHLSDHLKDATKDDTGLRIKIDWPPRPVHGAKGPGVE